MLQTFKMRKNRGNKKKLSKIFLVSKQQQQQFWPNASFKSLITVCVKIKIIKIKKSKKCF